MYPLVHGTKRLVLISLFVALTFVGSLIQIPMYPAPITLQTFFVMLSGFTLGPLAGAKAQTLYILMGLLGLPVFTGGGGLGYIIDPRFGFILGFIPLAVVCGYSFNCKSPKCLILAAILGTTILYVIGTTYIWLILSYISAIETSYCGILKGMLIFVPGDLIKIIFVIPIAIKLRKIL